MTSCLPLNVVSPSLEHIFPLLPVLSSVVDAPYTADRVVQGFLDNVGRETLLMKEGRSGTSKVVDRERRNGKVNALQGLVESVRSKGPRQAASSRENQVGVASEFSQFLEHGAGLSTEIDDVRLASLRVGFRYRPLARFEVDVLPASMKELGLPNESQQDDV